MEQRYNNFDKQLRQDFEQLADTTAAMPLFTQLYGGSVQEGELSSKCKELMAMAIGVVLDNEGCIIYHLKNALAVGATPAEVYEAADVAIMMGGGPAVVGATRILHIMSEIEEAKQLQP